MALPYKDSNFTYNLFTILVLQVGITSYPTEEMTKVSGIFSQLFRLKVLNSMHTYVSDHARRLLQN